MRVPVKAVVSGQEEGSGGQTSLRYCGKWESYIQVHPHTRRGNAALGNLVLNVVRVRCFLLGLFGQTTTIRFDVNKRGPGNIHFHSNKRHCHCRQNKHRSSHIGEALTCSPPTRYFQMHPLRSNSERARNKIQKALDRSNCYRQDASSSNRSIASRRAEWFQSLNYHINSHVSRQ